MFYDRRDAARQLSPRLEKYKDTSCIVLAVPRGGIPLGAVIAHDLDCPLEPFLSKKIGHPSNPELAIGSVTLYGIILEDRSQVDPEYIQHEKHRIQKTLLSRHEAYKNGKKPLTLKDKTVILLDDGAATGYTIVAAAKAVRKEQPKKIVIALPVCSSGAVKRIHPVADELICLLIPDRFRGVSEFYHDFSQVSDEEALRLLLDSDI